MDPQEARRRVEQGGAVLCLDVPEGTEMRIDLQAWRAGPLFQGIKMIPPGIHLVSWAAGHETVGCLLAFRPGQVEVWRWDAREEDMDRVPDREEAERLALGVRNFDFDSRLGPYPEGQGEAWTRLTYLISLRVLERTGIAHGQKLSGAPSLPQETEGEEGAQPAHQASASGGPCFAAIPALRKPVGMDPSQVSQYHMDGTCRVQEMLTTHFEGHWEDLLGQLQLSFVMFIAISSFQGLEHWKRLVALLCTCGSLARSNPPLMSEFVRVLRREMEQLPEDFFRDELLSDSFLRSSLTALCQEAEACAEAQGAETGKDQQLFQRRVQRLRKMLSQRFGLQIAVGEFGALDALALDMDADGGMCDSMPPSPLSSVLVAPTPYFCRR